MRYKTRIFCVGETGADCVSGHLETWLPIKVGHIHKIKGRDWKCVQIGPNSNGEPLADFRPLDIPRQLAGSGAKAP